MVKSMSVGYVVVWVGAFARRSTRVFGVVARVYTRVVACVIAAYRFLNLKINLSFENLKKKGNSGQDPSGLRV